MVKKDNTKRNKNNREQRKLHCEGYQVTRSIVKHIDQEIVK